MTRLDKMECLPSAVRDHRHGIATASFLLIVMIVMLFVIQFLFLIYLFYPYLLYISAFQTFFITNSLQVSLEK